MLYQRLPKDYSLVISVCCIKDMNYRWFDLPKPMGKKEAEDWADKNIGTPINFKTLKRLIK